MEWKSIDTAPFQKVVWVRNKLMGAPVKATRGYAPDGVVHPDMNFFTSVFTPDKHFPISAGQLVCPTEWADVEPEKRK